MLISNTAGYKVFCETKRIDALPDSYHVRVYTTYEHSKEPDYQQNKLDIILSSTELEYLKSALTPRT
jgi:hypothetical protein